MRGLFVTATDTEVGKSVTAAAIVAALVARGKRVAAFKPAVTGVADEPGPFGRDHELLASVANAGQAPDDVAPYRFDPPLSPHLAAELAGVEIDPTRLVEHARSQAARAEVIVCEGVGGLLVPLTANYLVRDLARDLALPLVVAARPGLGTINHTLLTLEAARAAGLTVAAVVFTPWPNDPEPIHHSNRDTIEQLGRVATYTLPHTTRAELAASAADLPLNAWLTPR